jgi:predicted DNA-binding transcriptional regulator YafY
MDRLERLVNLVVALLDTRRPLSRQEVRQRVGGYSDDEDNFHRNFERDKDLLRQMGIPVVTEPLDPALPEAGTGYRVPRDLYELPDPGLDEDELVALGLAASAVALGGAGQASVTTALWKLAGASGAASSAGRPPAATPGTVLADVAVDEKVATLFAAVTERRVACFAYNGLDRRVNPYGLSYREGKWYLAGFDHGRDGERLFRTDRISGPVELEGTAGAFERPEGVPTGPAPPWRLGDDEEIVVDLKVDASQAQWARALAGESSVTGTGPDGTTYLRLRVTNRAAFRSVVLGFLDHAEVLGPPEVRDEIVQWLYAAEARDTPGRRSS